MVANATVVPACPGGLGSATIGYTGGTGSPPYQYSVWSLVFLVTLFLLPISNLQKVKNWRKEMSSEERRRSESEGGMATESKGTKMKK